MTTHELEELSLLLTGLLTMLDGYPNHKQAHPSAIGRIRAALASVKREQRRRCWANPPEGWEPAIVRRKV